MNLAPPNPAPPRPAAPKPPRRSRGAAWWWLALLVLCVSLTRVGQFAAARAAFDYADYETGRGRFSAYAPEVGEGIEAQLEPLRGQSFEQVRARLGRRHPPQTAVPVDRGFHYRIPGKAFGPEAQRWYVWMRFRYGRLNSWDAYPNPDPYPGPPAPWGWLAWAPVALLALGPLLWLAGLAGFVTERDERPRYAQLALAGVLVTAFGWLAAPDALADAIPRAGLVAHAAGLTMLVSLLPVARWLLSLRRTPGGRYCHACGYDLTGNQSGVCPECGTATPQHVRHQHEQEVQSFAEVLRGELVVYRREGDDGDSGDKDDCEAAEAAEASRGTTSMT